MVSKLVMSQGSPGAFRRCAVGVRREDVQPRAMRKTKEKWAKRTITFCLTATVI